MLRHLAALAVGIAAFLAVAAPADAAVNWAAKYKTFANTRCETPQVVADIDQSAGIMRSENNGTTMLSNQRGFSVEQATTVEASADKLVCELAVSVFARGRTSIQHGKFTIQLFGTKWRSHWKPGY